MPDALAKLTAALGAHGLSVIGALHPTAGDGDGDGAPEGTGTLVLAGPDGPAMWAAFRAAPEAQDGAPNPLDRWSRRVIGAIAAGAGGTALFPFEGPPFHPFLRWARRGAPVWPSRLGLLIHSEHGLWVAFRGAIALAERVDLGNPAPAGERPCDPCPAPCLSACPVDAFTAAGFDAGRCRAHLAAPEGRPCREGGCLARRACPVGRAFAHAPGQAAFHIAAFAG